MSTRQYYGTDINIEDVQKVQLEILIEFDRICRKNNIEYQLFAGTLLGAIRHKGFIPWDDDIDVCLLRSDYEKFIECCKIDLKSNYFLQYYDSDEKAILQFAKIRKNNTIFTNMTYQDTGMHNGIYIDVFPLDNVKPDSFKGNLQPKLFNLSYIISSSRMKNRAIHAKNRVNRTIRLMFYYILKIVPKKSIDKLIQKTLCMFENENTEYVNHLTNGVSKQRLEKYLRKKNTFYNIEYAEFEGHMFPIPENYHDVLTRNFGNYMKLPPEEKRYTHHGIIEVNFDTTK